MSFQQQKVGPFLTPLKVLEATLWQDVSQVLDVIRRQRLTPLQRTTLQNVILCHVRCVKSPAWYHQWGWGSVGGM